MVSKIQSLRRLTYRHPGPEHQQAFEKQIEPGQNHRGACLLICSQLENALTDAIEARLRNLTNDIRHELFEQDGPLATFARKISMATALGILGPKSQHNFRIIRHIRNAFAHCRIPVDFETQEINDACRELHLIDPLHPFTLRERINVKEDSRGLFEDVCASMMLTLHACAGYRIVDEQGQVDPLNIDRLP